MAFGRCARADPLSRYDHRLEVHVRNWGGNIRVRAKRVVSPTSVRDLRRVVHLAQHVRVLGALHSFSPVLLAPDVAVLTQRLPRSIRVLPDSKQVDDRVTLVRVEGRWSMGELGAALHRRGLALQSMGSSVLPTFFGSLATATHGSGLSHGSMSNRDLVRGVELVLGDGSLVTLSDDDPASADAMNACRAGLGLTGVMIAATIACVSPYRLFIEMEKDTLQGALNAERWSNGDPYTLFWFPHTETASRVTLSPTQLSATGARARELWSEGFLENVVLGAAVWASNRAPQVLVPATMQLVSNFADGADYIDHWHHAMTGLRLFKGMSMEHGVPLERLPDAMRAVQDVVEQFANAGVYALDLPVDIRVSRGDGEPYMSAAYGRDTAWIDVATFPGTQHYEPFLQAIEVELRKLGGRPHLGKIFYQSPKDVWDPEAWGRFWRARDAMDPHDTFMSPAMFRMKDGGVP
ncbi:MAG: FAD/FMN-containing dehydrogenase [Kiritimatiellia bacterium]|jgi:FAD/FMN-containing dehydrogenase